MGTARGRIRIDYEGEGFQQSEQGFQRVSESAKRTNFEVSDTVKSLGKMVTTLTLFGAQAAQVAGAAVAAVGTIGAAFVSAGAAVGALGAAVKPQFQAISDVSKLYDEAVAAIDSRSEDAKEKMKAYKDALNQLPPATRETALAFNGLKNDFRNWSDSLSSTTMPLFTRGIRLLRDLLPSLTPLVQAAAGAFSTFLGDIESGVRSGGIQEFIGQLAKSAEETLPAFLRSAKNIVVGFGGIISAFLPFSTTMTGGIEELTAKFATWGQELGGSSGFQSFIDNMKTSGPVILDILKNLAIIFGNATEAATPLSAISLETTKALTAMAAALPEPVLKALTVAIVAATIAYKAYSTGVAIATGFQTAFGTAAEPGPLRRLWTALTATTRALKTFVLWLGRSIASLARMAAQSIAQAVAALGRLAASAARAAASMAIVAARAAASGLATLASTVVAAAVQYGTMAAAALRAAAAQAALTARLVAQRVVMLAIRTAVLAWTAAQWLLNAALLANPIGLIILAIVALVAIFILAWKNSETFRNIVTGAFEAVSKAISAAVKFIVNFVKNHWRLLIAIMLGPLGIIIGLVTKYWSQIRDFIKGAINAIVGFVKAFVSRVIADIRRIVGIVGAIARIFNQFNQAIFSRITSALRAIGRLPGQIIGVFRNAGRWLLTAGKNIVIGLINGVVSMFNRLRRTFSNLTSWIPDWKGPASVDRKLLTDNGRLIMQSLIKGFEDKLPDIQAALKMVTNHMVTTTGASLPPATQYLPNGFAYTPQTPVTTNGGASADEIAAAIAGALSRAGVGQVSLDGKVISEVVGRIHGRATNSQRRTR